MAEPIFNDHGDTIEIAVVGNDAVVVAVRGPVTGAEIVLSRVEALAAAHRLLAVTGGTPAEAALARPGNGWQVGG